ncbi:MULTISPECIES: hypothetical protein [unclassified Nonomuraea]|uniref:hypothetical protein n=1 Tax=unclassified Nonomuraea TaxID=2593643 RepID=UPI0033EE35C7
MSRPEISDTEAVSPDVLKDFGLERYRYILQQLNTLNDNVYKFLGIYQTLTTAIAGAALALFVGYKNWDIPPHLARSGVVGLLFLETVVAFFAVLIIVTGILSWIDYRREEVELTDRIVHSRFRRAPTFRNFWRWHELYIIIFILVSTLSLWICAYMLILPGIR